MIFQILQNGLSLGQNLVLLAVMLITVLGSMTLHELAHGYASLALGDPTAKKAGRLSLNPLKHLDPVGTALMVFCGFGWAKAVPVDPRYYKNPKKGMALTALAGPLVNLIMGVSCAVFLSVFFWVYETGLYRGFPLISNMSADTYETVYMIAYILLYYNLLLAVFNMLPVPPFDGSRLLFAFLPDRIYFGVMKYEKLIMLAMFFMLWTGVFTGVFEFFVDGIIRIVSGGVFFVLELLVKLFSHLV